MRFSRQECWSGLPCPPPGDLPYPKMEPMSLISPALTCGYFTTSATWETQEFWNGLLFPPPRDLPDARGRTCISCSFCIAGRFFITEPLGKSKAMMKMLVVQSRLPLCNPIDYSPLGSSVYGILQARILEWVTILFSRRSSWPRDWTLISHNAGGFFVIWAIREPFSIKWSLWSFNTVNPGMSVSCLKCFDGFSSPQD